MRLGLCSFFLGAALLASSVGYAGITEAVQSLNARNYKAAFDEFSYLASEGDATAAYYLGYMHQMGLGIPVNFPQAMSWFQRAAENFFLSFPDAKILPCGSETKEETTLMISSFFHAGRQ